MSDTEHISLREFIERIIDERDKQYSAAQKDLERRLEGMNMFRDQLKEQAVNFVTRPEHEIFRREIDSLKISRATLEGKASQFSVNVATCIGVVGIVISLVVALLKFVH